MNTPLTGLVAGLLLTLAGPLILASPFAQSLYGLAGPAAAAAGQVALCLLVAAVLCILRFGEGAPLSGGSVSTRAERSLPRTPRTRRG